MKEIIIHSPEALQELIPTVLKMAGGKLKFALTGEIGAGKTTFVKAICTYFGVQEQVASPTFSLINQYAYNDSKNSVEKLIHHIDLYRLKTYQEAIDIGIEDYLYDASYCFIEWPGIIQGLLPEGTVKINFEILDNSSRKILFL